MGRIEENILDKLYFLLSYGKEEEIIEFSKSPYYQKNEDNEDNIINDFQEYIQDNIDWELYKETMGYGNRNSR